MEDSPTLKGPGPTLYVSEKSGSNKSWLLKTSNINIFIFIKIHIQEGPITRDKKNRGYTHFEGSRTHIHVSEKSRSFKSWHSNRNIFIFIKIHIQEGPITRDPKKNKKNILQQGSAVAGKNRPYIYTDKNNVWFDLKIFIDL